VAAAAGSIPLGRAGDAWGRRPLLVGGMVLGVVTSLALPVAEHPAGLLAIYAIAGLGVAAFTPSALSLVGESAPRGRIAYAYGWYSTAHYGAIAVGPFVGGLVTEWWGYRPAFVVSGLVFLVLGAGNTVARFPTGWLVDRTGRPTVYAVGGVALACGSTALFPGADGALLLFVAALFGVASGVAFVAISTGLAVAAPP